MIYRPEYSALLLWKALGDGHLALVVDELRAAAVEDNILDACAKLFLPVVMLKLETNDYRRKIGMCAVCRVSRVEEV